MQELLSHQYTMYNLFKYEIHKNDRLNPEAPFLGFVIILKLTLYFMFRLIVINLWKVLDVQQERPWTSGLSDIIASWMIWYCTLRFALCNISHTTMVPFLTTKCLLKTVSERHMTVTTTFVEAVRLDQLTWRLMRPETVEWHLTNLGSQLSVETW